MNGLVRDERGQVTFWVLGLAVAVLGLGGISLDLWRVMGARAELAAVAESAAVAGASGVDVDAFRADDSVIVLSDAEARALAEAVLAQNGHTGPAGVTVDPTVISVTLEGTVDLTLLRLLTAGAVDSIPISVTATSQPRAG